MIDVSTPFPSDLIVSLKTKIAELEQQVEWFRHNQPDLAVKYDFLTNRVRELEYQLSLLWKDAGAEIDK